MNLKTVMALAIAASFAAPVLAQQAPRSADVNNDGRVSHSEFDVLEGTAPGAAGATGDMPGHKPEQKQ